MPKKKRVYTHRKDRHMPVEHGSILDELDHDFGGVPVASSYKTPRRKKKLGLFE